MPSWPPGLLRVVYTPAARSGAKIGMTAEPSAAGE